MTDTPQLQAGDLARLAEAKFEKLSKAESLLLEKASSGETVVYGPNENQDDRQNDPRHGDRWGSSRTIRAGIVCWLCTDREASKIVHWKGIQIYGANIDGAIDLAYASIPFPLSFQHCRMVNEVDLTKCEVSELTLSGSLVHGITADGLIVKNDVLLDSAFSSVGQASFLGAQIGGQLICDEANFTARPVKDDDDSGISLKADGIVVKSDVSFSDGFSAKGEVRLLGAHIGGQLDCSGGTFANEPQKDPPGSGIALHADGIEVKSDVFLSDGFSARGEVRLLGAQIGGQLDCSGGMFTNPPLKDFPQAGDVLYADGIVVKGDVFLSDGFSARGGVRFLGAQIGGQFDCSGGTFANEPQKDPPGSGIALHADEIEVKSDVSLSDSFSAYGQVRFLYAKVGGNFLGTAGTFSNPPQKDIAASGLALHADGINVKNGVYLRNAHARGPTFAATGEVRFRRAVVEGDIDCSGGVFTNPKKEGVETSGTALTLERTVAMSGVFLSGGFSAEGEINCRNARIAGPFFLTNGNFQAATLDLTDASANSLSDSGAKWPTHGKLLLDGFVYGRIYSSGPIDVNERIRWLGLQPTTPFRQRPYIQLANVLKDAGDQPGAVQVLETMEELRRGSERHGPMSPAISWVLRKSIGYGYDPGQAIWEIVILSALGWVIYRRSYLAGTIAPTDKDAYDEFKAKGRGPAHYPPFSPLVYSLENSLPLVKLGQADKWHPDPEPEPQDPCARNISVPKLGYHHTWNRQPNRLQNVWRELLCVWERTPQRFRQSCSWTLLKFERLLILLGLRRDSDPQAATSFLSRFAVSPRFLSLFLWLQILLGWLLATLFVAGVSGVIHKE